MQKVTKKAKTCKTCKQITEREQIEETCDLKRCGKIIKWSNATGYPFKIDPILHDENLHSDAKYFCCFEHGLEWMKTKSPLKVKEDFVSFYLHKKEYAKLQKLLRSLG